MTTNELRNIFVQHHEWYGSMRGYFKLFILIILLPFMSLYVLFIFIIEEGKRLDKELTFLNKFLNKCG